MTIIGATAIAAMNSAAWTALIGGGIWLEAGAVSLRVVCIVAAVMFVATFALALFAFGAARLREMDDL